jgi:hypothetical protein
MIIDAKFDRFIVREGKEAGIHTLMGKDLSTRLRQLMSNIVNECPRRITAPALSHEEYGNA